MIAYLAQNHELYAMTYELHDSNCSHHSSYQAELRAYRLTTDQICQQLNMTLHYLVT